MKIYVENVINDNIQFSTEYGQGRGKWKSDDSPVKKEYLIELRRKNEILKLCKLWKEKDIIIEPDDFLGVQETLILQEKILSKLDFLDKEDLSIIHETSDRKNIASFTKFVLANIDEQVKYVFFVKYATKLGGIVLEGKEIRKNCDFILSESEYFYDGCSIFFCTPDGGNGVCFWKGEYDSRIYTW